MSSADIIRVCEVSLTFLGQLAWPTLVLVLLLKFKSQLLELVPRLQHISVRGVELALRDKVQQAQEQAMAASGAASAQTPNHQSLPAEVTERLELLGTNGATEEVVACAAWARGEHPREVIVSAWAGIERSISRDVDLLRELNMVSGRQQLPVIGGPIEMLMALHRYDPSMYSDQMIQSVRLLFDIRRDVVRYCFEVSQTIADTYLNTAFYLQRTFYITGRHLMWAISYARPRNQETTHEL